MQGLYSLSCYFRGGGACPEVVSSPGPTLLRPFFLSLLGDWN